MSSHRVRELYHAGGCTVYRLSNTKSIEEGVDNLLSIPNRYNSCCSRRAAAVFGRRLRQLAPTAIETEMHENSIRFPRLAHLEQWRFENCSTLKPHYSNASNHHWNTGTMQIRYCGLVDKNSRRFSHVFNNRGYAVPIVPLFQRRFSTLQSCGFGVEQFSDRHCSTCSNISGVIV